MKRILSALLSLVVAATLLVLVPISKHHVLAVHAQDDCSNATLTGNYGFAFSGFQIQQNTSVPFYGAGLATFKAGTMSANFATSVNGFASINNPYTAHIW